MVVEFNTVNNILATLPIGYYLGRKIPVELSKGTASYFNPVEDKIVIGYGLIAASLENIDSTKYDYNLEEIIRGLLYHEVSHVILTPAKHLFDNCRTAEEKHIVNTFEDERIETLLSKTYMNTNFKKNLIILNGGIEDKEPENAYEAFYNIVRFHRGKEKFLKKVANIIATYAKINSTTTNYKCDEYTEDILDLYTEIKKDFEQDKQSQNKNNSSSNQNNTGSNDNNSQNNDQNNSNGNNQTDTNSNQNDSNDSNQDDTNNSQSSNSNDSNNDDSDSNNDSSNSSSDGSQNNDKTNTDKTDTDKTDTNDNSSSSSAGDQPIDDTNDQQSTSNSLTDEQVNDIIKDLDININEDSLKQSIKSTIKKVFDTFYNPQLTMQIQQLIDEKVKQKNKNGNAINSYSGRFNVRAVGNRDDYKWWSQQNRQGHIRQYSKVHINLFIDNSGSFSDNDTQMNTFIRAMEKVVSKDFDFDVITINTDIVEWKDTKKRFSSGGGTRLPAYVKDVIKRHTKSAANNYNVVLFDGDADPELVEGSNAFRYFDGPNTIIVTDNQNRFYIESAIHQAKVIFCDDYNYCDEFIESVLQLLHKVL